MGLLDPSHVLEGVPAVASGASDVRDANAAHSDPERDTLDAWQKRAKGTPFSCKQLTLLVREDIEDIEI